MKLIDQTWFNGLHKDCFMSTHFSETSSVHNEFSRVQEELKRLQVNHFDSYLLSKLIYKIQFNNKKEARSKVFQFSFSCWLEQQILYIPSIKITANCYSVNPCVISLDLYLLQVFLSLHFIHCYFCWSSFFVCDIKLWTFNLIFERRKMNNNNEKYTEEKQIRKKQLFCCASVPKQTVSLTLDGIKW